MNTKEDITNFTKVLCDTIVKPTNKKPYIKIQVDGYQELGDLKHALLHSIEVISRSIDEDFVVQNGLDDSSHTLVILTRVLKDLCLESEMQLIDQLINEQA